MQRALGEFAELRKVDVGYDVAPALTFFPAPPRPAAAIKRNQATPVETPVIQRPASSEELAFCPVVELSVLFKSRQVSSTELTKIYLERLKRFDPLLKCVVTLTEDLALKQAAQADREIAAGHYRGALHGIPWGAKDLIAYPGYPTTWGATPYKGRVIDGKATVATRLEEAGAVMLGKLSLGALGDGRPLVRRADPQPVGPAGRLERLVGRLGIRGRGWTGGLCNRQRDAGQHHLALQGMWGDRSAAHVRSSQPARLHDARVVDGQAGPDHTLDRGLCTGLRRDPRRRRSRLRGRRSAFRVAAAARSRES